MKAMILAAGLGTRLRPFTNTRPKALFTIQDIPLIEIVLKRLMTFGVSEVIINLHHFPQQIIDFLKSRNHFGMHIEFSLEEKLLDTGGGLKKAANFFDDDQPFFLHNVDVLSDVDLNLMVQQQKKTDCLATLAVNQRQTKRYLIFDECHLLCGWKSLLEKKEILVRSPSGRTVELAFGGMHVIAPAIFTKAPTEEAFSIIDWYLQLARTGERIGAFRIDQYSWQDIGKFKNEEKRGNRR